MTEAHYEQLGFSKTVVIRDPVTNLRFPEDREISRFLQEQRALFVDVYRNELPELRQSLPARKCNPMRHCVAADVIDGYRLLLHRDPESEAILQQHVGRRAVHVFVKGLTESPEYNAILAAPTPPQRPLDPTRPCTRDDVVNGYHLIMHRDLARLEGIQRDHRPDRRLTRPPARSDAQPLRHRRGHPFPAECGTLRQRQRHQVAQPALVLDLGESGGKFGR